MAYIFLFGDTLVGGPHSALLMLHEVIIFRSVGERHDTAAYCMLHRSMLFVGNILLPSTLSGQSHVYLQQYAIIAVNGSS